MVLIMVMIMVIVKPMTMAIHLITSVVENGNEKCGNCIGIGCSYGYRYGNGYGYRYGNEGMVVVMATVWYL